MKTTLLTLLLLTTNWLTLKSQSDNCLTAIGLNECEITGSTNTGSTIGADDNYLAGDVCAIVKEKSVWYSFVATQTGPYTFSVINPICSGSTLLETGVFSGSCGSLNPVNCNASTSSYSLDFNAVSGQTYFFVIDGITGSDCSFDAVVCPGCNLIASFSPDVTTGPYPLTVTFTNTGSGGIFHHWDFGTESSSFDGTNGSFTYEEPGTFYVSLISDNGVCSDTVIDTIVVTGTSALEIPNIFTPNGDAMNDVYRVRCFGIDTIDVQVFNRWGELIGGYSGNKGWWDGYSIIAGLPCATGVYYVYVKAIGIDGTVFDEKKVIHLFR